jgi:hypothetical protein
VIKATLKKLQKTLEEARKIFATELIIRFRFICVQESVWDTFNSIRDESILSRESGSEVFFAAA